MTERERFSALLDVALRMADDLLRMLEQMEEQLEEGAKNNCTD